MLSPIQSIRLSATAMTTILSHSASAITGFIRSTYEYMMHAILLVACSCTNGHTGALRLLSANTIQYCDTRVHSYCTNLRKPQYQFQYLERRHCPRSDAYFCRNEDFEQASCTSFTSTDRLCLKWVNLQWMDNRVPYRRFNAAGN